MKLYRFAILSLAAMSAVACSDINGQDPETGEITAAQSLETNAVLSERADAVFAGMYTIMGQPYSVFGSSGRADDFGFIMSAISADCEGADYIYSNSGYNWFSVACAYTSRNANYANPYIRYNIPYKQIGLAQQVWDSYPSIDDLKADINSGNAATVSAAKKKLAKKVQARAVRAFDYLMLAPFFQFGYSVAGDSLCIPVLNEDVKDYSNNPRATVKQVYEQILKDLNVAIENLKIAEYVRSSKSEIDLQVAYGLRARANLAMGNWADAAADAELAMAGYTPATIEEVSVPQFNNITAKNWMWGIDITDAMVQSGGYATSSSWVSVFSGDGYTAACQLGPMINKLLYDKISSTDVRKGWWLDASLHSPNIANLSWTCVSGGATVTKKGDEICNLVADDGSKDVFLPYTSVKFGQLSGVGNTLNNNDWPLMRVEEMYLIAAEGYAKSNQEDKARNMLNALMKNRDLNYNASNISRTLADEIWFQRRVELWGEGFFISDAKRLNKPIVRFHADKESNYPAAYQFNISADDGWLNMRFPQTEKDNNAGIVDNTGGTVPSAGQNPNLRDGVTD